jgi:hypothetical protein
MSGGAQLMPDVTPAMTDAGALALYDSENDEMFNSSEERVTRIFLAMWKARVTK